MSRSVGAPQRALNHSPPRVRSRQATRRAMSDDIADAPLPPASPDQCGPSFATQPAQAHTCWGVLLFDCGTQASFAPADVAS